ncbi:hypothetical protein M0R45_014738 [Rubus argutus]|uniref:Casein kinase substrate phosphoprotein PP28 domain-containing protein n=1 Tax=Rubus argutus TaxID=59490 RepID=A0AAW1XNS4_RUBAR
MGRGKFKGKPTGHRHFSTHEEMVFNCCCTFISYELTMLTLSLYFKWLQLLVPSSRPRSFKREEAEDEEEVESEEESEEEEESEKRKGTQGLIEIENPNLVKPKNVKAKNVDLEKTTELSRREREEIEKQKAHERYMRLQEQGKTEQAKKDLGAEAAKKREEEKAAKEQKKGEGRK